MERELFVIQNVKTKEYWYSGVEFLEDWTMCSFLPKEVAFLRMDKIPRICNDPHMKLKAIKISLEQE